MAAPHYDVTGYDFTGLSDLDLVVMQKQVRDSKVDLEFLAAVMNEIAKRAKCPR